MACLGHDGCKCDACVDLMIKVDQQLLQEAREREARRKAQHRKASAAYYLRKKADVLRAMNEKYREDPVFRERVKQSNLKRYHEKGKRVMQVGGVAVLVDQ